MPRRPKSRRSKYLKTAFHILIGMKGTYVFSGRIVDVNGLHERPAEAIFRIASMNEGDVFVTCNGRTQDAKDILNLLTLAAEQDSDLSFSVEVGQNSGYCIKMLKCAISDPDLTGHFRTYISAAQYFARGNKRNLAPAEFRKLVI
jgi:phosphotransferase system HPr (HPr) family protein